MRLADGLRTREEVEQALGYCLAMMVVEMRKGHDECSTIAARCCDLLEWMLKKPTPGAEKFNEIKGEWLKEVAENN